MTEMETRLPCPVCIGTRMEKVWAAGGAFALDCCRRCGGVWFEQGEVHHVRRLEQARTTRRLGAAPDVARAPCHECRAPLGRDAETCAACGHHVHLACPACQQTMAAAALDDLRLDVCGSCRGVWFDRHEIAGIWSAQVQAALATAPNRSPVGADPSGLLLFDALAYSPDVAFYGVYAAGELAGSAGPAVAGAADTLSGAADAVSAAAASVFEVIADIIGGIFS
ncbi:MAG: zf-TFIIB domain-containing protein [Longimicrobiales bacterium]